MMMIKTMMMTFMICKRVKMRLDDLPSDHERDIGVKDSCGGGGGGDGGDGHGSKK